MKDKYIPKEAEKVNKCCECGATQYKVGLYWFGLEETLKQRIEELWNFIEELTDYVTDGCFVLESVDEFNKKYELLQQKERKE